MKVSATLWLLFTAASITAQIPNSDFENWSFNGSNYDPDDWQTENNQNQEPVTQDLEPYQGEYAMKVTAIPYALGEFGEARTSFPNEVVPPSLDFWVKSSVENGMVGVEIEFYNQDLLVYSEQWFTSEQIDEWTFVSLPLNQIEPVLTDASIIVMAIVGDFAPGDAEISIDAISFGQTQSVSDYSKYNVSIFPNPTQNLFTIQDEEGSVEFVEIYSIDGKLINSVQVNVSGNREVDVSNLSSGIYQVILKAGEKTLGTEKLVVSK